jgi:K+-sensing histidine kinase KdpD
VHPAEPVPDAFLRASEIKLVDLAPAALRHRLAEGLVVPQERVDAALSSYFRFANLAALRELAQLWLDDSVPDPVTTFLAARDVSDPVQASVIVVGLEGSPADEWLIRYAARLAGLSDARLQGYTSGLSTTLAGQRERGWSKTAGCLASCTGLWSRSGPVTPLPD